MTQLAARPPALTRPLEPRRGFGSTSRPDNWWVQPLTVFTVFTAFILYSTWAGVFGRDYYYSGNLLSPFFSPEIYGASHHALLGPRPAWWPAWLIFSPAFLILWAPVSFRLTCYYYRGAYYKAFWADPPSCAVGEPRKSYIGERAFPLIVMNIHRYTLIFALALLVFLASDAWKALWFTDEATGATSFGVSVGTIVLTLNVLLLGAYTLGCHSLRHLVGGRLVQISQKPAQYSAYKGVSWLNRRHMLFAWCSLVWVAVSDIYVRLCAMGIISDVRFF